MKYSTTIESNNVNDLNQISDLVYDLKYKFSEEKFQTIKLKINYEIEVI